MANEIKLTITTTIQANGVSSSTSIEQFRDLTGDQVPLAYQIIGTSAEAIDLGAVLAGGPIVLRNMDATNFVQVDEANTINAAPQKLLPGEAIVIRAQTATLYGKADTDPCVLEIQAL